MSIADRLAVIDWEDAARVRRPRAVIGGTLQRMRLAGSASWRFAEGIEQAPLVALFVRDVEGLRIPPGDGLPPRLDDELPGGSTLLDSEQRATAGSDWTGWWQAIVAHEIRVHQGTPDAVDQQVWMRQMAAERAGVFDPPDFASLNTSPALREAVHATFGAALRWVEAQRRALLMPPQGRHGQFDYDIVRAVAEQVAHHHRVSPDAVRACALVLPVKANWWSLVASGAVLCSTHAARDPIIARSVLTEAFESGLAS